MEVFGQLAGGFATALQPINMAMLFIAVVLGLVIGVLPGLGGTSGVAILLPVTVFIAHGSLPGSDATTAIIFLAGIYWGALFGGVITSILFNIPGEPWAVVLLFDGFPLAKRLGRPGLALASSFVSSFLGALVSTILFTFFALPIALKALQFGPAELFAVFVLSFATLIGLGAEAPMKSLAMLALGLLLAAVGFDTITGEQRLNFGFISLLSGISFVPVTIGLFVWGLQPGPVLFIQHPDFVWGLIASIYLGHLLTFILCLLAVPLLAMIMRVPYAIITPFIVVISIIGSYSLNNSMLDVFITVVFGVIGYWLRKMKYPLAPLVVALVLGDSTERELRKALIAGHGSPLYFFNSGLSTALMLTALVLVLIPLFRTLRARRAATVAGVSAPKPAP